MNCFCFSAASRMPRDRGFSPSVQRVLVCLCLCGLSVTCFALPVPENRDNQQTDKQMQLSRIMYRLGDRGQSSPYLYNQGMVWNISESSPSPPNSHSFILIVLDSFLLMQFWNISWISSIHFFHYIYYICAIIKPDSLLIGHNNMAWNNQQEWNVIIMTH